MILRFKSFLIVAVLVGVVSALPVRAANYFSDNQPIDNVVNSGRVQPLGEVEVVEFFWYGCPHCAAFEPQIQQWVKALPPQVKFIRLPASWNPTMLTQQRLYFTLEALNRLDLHNKVFSDIHTKKLKLTTTEQISRWASTQKINPTTWNNAYKSQAVTDRAAYAQAAFQRFELTWVPAIVVNGKRVVAYTPDILTNAQEAVQQELHALESSTIKGK